MSSIKQVIVMRKEYEINGQKQSIRKGKMIAQGAHASMKVFFDRITNLSETEMTTNITAEMFEWINNSFAKICCYVNTEDELLAIYNSALSAGIPAAIIQDSGRTEFHGIPTYTAVAIGPDHADKVDQITGKLPLL
jgi:peptidyl-tRNA hydrolase, PTH2 family